jgi:hypothetical protein
MYLVRWSSTILPAMPAMKQRVLMKVEINDWVETTSEDEINDGVETTSADESRNK